MSDFLLDTDVLVRCLRAVPETLQLARDLTEEGDLHISVWSQIEVLTLAQPKEEKGTLEFLAPFVLHPVNDLIAQRASALLKRAPTTRPLSFAQAVIAATALQHGLVLVSYGSETLRVEGLKVYPLARTVAQRGNP